MSISYNYFIGANILIHEEKKQKDESAARIIPFHSDNDPSF